MNNQVNRLRFEVTCPDEALSFNLRQNFAQTFQGDIADVIDEVCAKYVTDAESLNIDKLEIDLGAFSRHGFNANFKQILTQKFEQELIKSLSKITPEERQASQQLTNAELLMHFLVTGMLPWWANESAIEISEIAKEVFEQQGNRFRSFFYQHKNSPKLWQRVLWQLDTYAREQVVNLSADLKKARELFAFWIAQLSSKIVELKNTSSGSSFAGLGDAPITYNERLMNDVLLVNATVIFINIDNAENLAPVFKQYISVVFKDNGILAGQISQLFTDNNIAAKNEAAADDTFVQQSTNDQMTDENLYHQNTDGAEIEKIAIKNAGIVILCPFMQRYFTLLNLLEDGKWKDQHSAFKAVHALKFLSSGIQKVPEYAMTPEKLLCGLALDAPIPLDIELTEEEIVEGESLLKAVIEHWQVLKNTSIDGLRETFLKRDGLLTKRDDNWVLQVERKTLDVLLDSIPWGYSTVNFSWSSNLLFVEW